MKLLFNMTININKDAHERWVSWMTHHHIPEIMATQCFESWKMSRVLGVDESQGINYALQLVAPSVEKFEDYRDNKMKELQELHHREFKDQYVVFMTLLETIDEGIFEGINN